MAERCIKGDGGRPEGPTLRWLEGSRDLLALAARRPARYPHLLETTAPGMAGGRWSMLLAFPGETLMTLPGGLASGGFLAALDKAWAQLRRPVLSDAAELPFAGGWFLYLGYELAAEIEPRLCLPASPQPLPRAMATRIPAAIVVDHEQARTALVVEPGREALLAEMESDLRAPAAALEAADRELIDDLVEEDPGRYLRGVKQVLELIRAGDVFQANLSRLWQARLRSGVDAAQVYARLRVANPAPFSALFRLPGAAVVSSSPERLLRLDGGVAQTRPIAGTRPRDRDLARDHAYAQELQVDPKERAEHVMLIDLERNDLGRICRPGSIAVDEMMVTESYAHVHHIVSNVRGELRPGVTPGQAIAAVFPGGTITGCPKVRCMEILAELEAQGRGAYTGSAGYLGHDGRMDLNILIRTLVVRREALSFRTGAGIVADSVPERELAETRAKARGLLAALGCRP